MYPILKRIKAHITKRKKADDQKFAPPPRRALFSFKNHTNILNYSNPKPLADAVVHQEEDITKERKEKDRRRDLIWKCHERKRSQSSSFG